jgi:hypothetical protein
MSAAQKACRIRGIADFFCSAAKTLDLLRCSMHIVCRRRKLGWA